MPAPPSATSEPASPSATLRATDTVTPSPSPSASPETECRPAVGGLRSESYHSSLLDRDIQVDVYVPACYRSLALDPPTVYFLHGKPFDESHWPSLGILERYGEGRANGRWRAALLVFPYVPEPLFAGTDGGPGSYEQEFLEALLPAVEEKFPPSARGDRSLAGISRGGIWALEIAMRHPERITTSVALSPSLAVNYARVAYDPMELAGTSDALPDQVLLVAGSDDWALPKTEDLAQRLEGRTRIEFHSVPGDHSDPTWAGSLPIVLDFLLGE